MYGGVGGCGTMRVHASPSLNKRGAEAAASGQEVTVRPGQSPVKQPLAVASPSPGAGPVGGASTVQDTDDRIPKDSIYGTIRMKRRQESQAAQAVQQGVHQVGKYLNRTEKIFRSQTKNIVRRLSRMWTVCRRPPRMTATMRDGAWRRGPRPGREDTTRTCW